MCLTPDPSSLTEWTVTQANEGLDIHTEEIVLYIQTQWYCKLLLLTKVFYIHSCFFSPTKVMKGLFNKDTTSSDDFVKHMMSLQDTTQFVVDPSKALTTVQYKPPERAGT